MPLRDLLEFMDEQQKTKSEKTPNLWIHFNETLFKTAKKPEDLNVHVPNA